MKRLIAPSILAADFNHLYDEILMINDSEADFIHFDVMDGVFVPNISFGLPVIEHVNKIARKPLDVHLMIVEPHKYLKDFKEAGAYYLNVHYEACNHLNRTVNEIKELGMKAAVTLNPHTQIELLEDIITDVDMVLIMSVNPGFGGQEFIENSYDRIKRLKELVVRKNSKALIEVDGGVDMDNAGKLYEAGVDVLVAGTTIFDAPDPKQMITDLKNG
ncbi:MAG: ribulose-phosphate 3-epimerase [Bacteroidales bacterium]|nr:MAG: ribulose-phosphate 3-epimerase [Bacteroidales bacterium]